MLDEKAAATKLDELTADYRLKSEKSKVIRLPNKWAPRHYQLPDLAALDNGKKRVISIWHRRAGKDSAGLNHSARAAHHRVGVYWHLLPTQKQAREVVWTNVDKQGRRMIDQAFPKELRKRTLEDEMMIEFKNGSFWKLRGADNFDSNVGANPAGIVFSEYALTDPRAWDYMRPILLENEGWAWFNTTPRGKNHVFDMLENAKTDPLWHWSVWPVDKTGILTQEQIDQERREGMSEARIQQEYYCRFDVANEGSVFGNQMVQAEKDGRICSVPHDAAYPVETAWDFGLRDQTAIWFIQRVGKEIRFIDFVCDRNKLLPHYLNIVNSKGYSYSRHVAPHDVSRTNYGDGTSIFSIAQNHGVYFTQAPKLKVEDGEEAGRAMLSRCRFDAVKCSYGIKALKHHQREYDEEKKVLKSKPIEDWSIDPCDAFRTYAQTPEAYGGIPQWAQQFTQSGVPSIGHNGGPPMNDYDPLAQFRS
jgi:phage terminase large subunit